MGEKPQDLYESMTNRIIEALQQGVVPWQRPWSSSGGVPRSLSTKKEYRGINVLLLGLESLMRGFQCSFWGTRKIIESKGGEIKVGEESSRVVFWQPRTIMKEDPKTGKKKPTFIPLLVSYEVFNADQVTWPEGKGPKVEVPQLQFEPLGAAEKVVREYLGRGPSFQEKEARAYYSPSKDLVNMPKRTTFRSREAWYSTFFHELTHSTGHSSRLKRKGVVEDHFFGDPTYSQEELVAELGACFLRAQVGMDAPEEFSNSAAYLDTWIKRLQEDHKLLLQASGQAQKAVTFILTGELPQKAGADRADQ